MTETTHRAPHTSGAAKARRLGRLATLVFGALTVALVIARSELSHTAYAHRGDGLLYAVDAAALGCCVVAGLIWAGAWLACRPRR